MVTNTFGKGLEEAYKDHQKKVVIPQIYLQALYFAQFFEYSLEQFLKYLVQTTKKKLQENGLNYKPKIKKSFTSKDYVERIETFFPRELNKDLFAALDTAMNKRNAFIHKSFKQLHPTGDSYINLDMDKYYLDKESLKTTETWLHAFQVANREIMRITEKFISKEIIIEGGEKDAKK